ncbi:hypothetical protein CMK18_01420 [Candidatus Poribacteria bacterium]|nr:hypothetical protein [Candidatus Poribacteria bacterium]
MSRFVALINDDNRASNQTTIYINLDNISTFDTTYPVNEEDIGQFRLTVRTLKETLTFKGEVAKQNIRLLEDAVNERNWSRELR